MIKQGSFILENYCFRHFDWYKLCYISLIIALKVTVTGVIMSEGDLNAKHIARAANVTLIPSSNEQ